MMLLSYVFLYILIMRCLGKCIMTASNVSRLMMGKCHFIYVHTDLPLNVVMVQALLITVPRIEPRTLDPLDTYEGNMLLGRNFRL